MALVIRQLPFHWEGDLEALQQEVGAAPTPQLNAWLRVARQRQKLPFGQVELGQQLEDLVLVELRCRRGAE